MADSSPLLPYAEAEQAEAPVQKPLLRRLIIAILMWGTPFASIISLLPFIHGQICPAMPSALAFSIIFAIVGIAKSPLLMYHSFQVRNTLPTPTRIKKKPSAEDAPSYKEYKTVYMIDKVLMVAQVLLALFWALPITLSKTYLFHEDSPDTCEHNIYVLVFVSGAVTAGIYALLAILFGLYLLCAKKK